MVFTKRSLAMTAVLVVLAVVSGCKKLSYKPSDVPVEFAGVKSVFPTKDGTFVVSWDEPANARDLVESYEIYRSDMSSLALNSQEDRAISAQLSGDDEYAVPIVKVDESEEPAVLGKVIATVKDSNNFTITNLPSGRYGIQVKAVGKNGTRDTNRKVALISVVLTVQFSGVDSAEYENGKVTLKWTPYKTTKKGEPIYYTIYEGSTFSNVIDHVSVDPASGTHPDSYVVTVNDRNPGDEVSFGVRVKDPEGKFDSNIKVAKLTIPPDATENFCTKVNASSTQSITVFFKIPDGAESLTIRRNGATQATIVDKTRDKYEDVALRQGTYYEYTCEVTRNNRIVRDSKVLGTFTRTSAAPTFKGIEDAIIDTATGKVKITWFDAYDVPPHYYDIYVSAGPVVQWGKGALKRIYASDIESRDISLVIAEIDPLGDDLVHSIGVRSCSAANICDANNVSRQRTVGDRGAPTSVGITAISLLRVSATGPKLLITAPWEPSNGGIATRRIYYHVARLGTSEANLPECKSDTVYKVYYLKDSRTYKRCSNQGSSVWQWQTLAAPANPAVDGFEMRAIGVSAEQIYDPPTQLELGNLKDDSFYTVIVRDADAKGQEATNLNFRQIETGDFNPPNFNGISTLELGPSSHALRDLDEDLCIAEGGTHSCDLRASSLIAKFIAPVGEEDVQRYQVYLKELSEPVANPVCPDPSLVVNPAGVLQGSLYGEIGVTDDVEAEYGNEKTVRFFNMGAPGSELHKPGLPGAIMISGLKERTAYIVCLRAVDKAGNVSIASPALVRSTIDITPPVFVGVQDVVYEKDDEALRVSWPASSSNDVLTYTVDVWAFDRLTNPDATPSYASTAGQPRSYASIPVDVSQTSAIITKSQVEKLKSNHRIYVVVNACDGGGNIPGGQQNCTKIGADKAKYTDLDDIEPPKFESGDLQFVQTRISRGEVKVEVKFNKPEVNAVDCLNTSLIASAGDGLCLNRATNKCYRFDAGAVTSDIVDCPIWEDVKGFSIYQVLGDSSANSELAKLRDCFVESREVAGAKEWTDPMTGDVKWVDDPDVARASCEINGLQPWRELRIHVRAFDKQNPPNITVRDPYQNSRLFRTLDDDAPEFSSNLRLEPDIASGGIRLEWGLGTDNQFSGEVSYQVFRKSGGLAGIDWLKSPEENGMTRLSEGSVTNFVDNMGIQGGETYVYTVCAIDSAFMEKRLNQNRTCDIGKAYTIPDTTPPQITSVKVLKFGTTTGELKDRGTKAWEIEVAVSDNKTPAYDLRVELCAVSSAIGATVELDANCPSIASLTATADSANPADIAFRSGKVKFRGSDNIGLGGEANVDSAIFYLVRVKEPLEGGGFLVASKPLTVESYNKMTLSSLKSDEGVIGGGDLIVLRGDGFSPSSVIKFGSTNCAAPKYLTSSFLTCKSPQVASTRTVNVSVSVDHPGLDGILTTSSTADQNRSFNYCDGSLQSGVGSCQNLCNKDTSKTLSAGVLFPQGDGVSADSPRLICTAQQLKNISSAGLMSANKYPFYKLGANIDLSLEANMRPIMNCWGWQTCLNFDGDNFAIANFKSTMPNNEPSENWGYWGLFRYMADGEVSNLALLGLDVSGKQRVGGLVGHSQNATIKNVLVNGKVTGQRDVGGLAGYVHGNTTLGDVAGAEVDISGSQYFIGGLVGYSWGPAFQTIETTGSSTTTKYSKLSATGTVRSTSTSDSHYGIGGLFGFLEGSGGTLDSPSFSGSIITTPQMYGVGGIAGGLRSGAGKQLIVDKASVSVALTSDRYVGGLVGIVNSMGGHLTVSNSEVRGSIVGVRHHIAGLVGHVDADFNLTLSSNLVEADVTGDYHVGGITGYATTTSGRLRILGNQSKGSISGYSNLGGLSGQLVANCTPYYNNPSDPGVEASIEVSNSTASGSVRSVGLDPTGRDAGNIGGAVGFARCVKMENVEASGMVSVQRQGTSAHGNHIGGFAGQLTSVLINNSRARGKVFVKQIGSSNAFASIGGFFGLVNGGWTLISNSRAFGDVEAADNTSHTVGGFGGNSQLGHDWSKNNITAPESKIVNSSSSGSVKLNYSGGSAYAGGFIGVIHNYQTAWCPSGLPTSVCRGISNDLCRVSPTSTQILSWDDCLRAGRLNIGDGSRTFGTYEKNRATGDVTVVTGRQVGGFVGRIFSETDNSCVWVERGTTSLTQERDIQCFTSAVGDRKDNLTGPPKELKITQNMSSGKVIADGGVGGFIGRMDTQLWYDNRWINRTAVPITTINGTTYRCDPGNSNVNLRFTDHCHHSSVFPQAKTIGAFRWLRNVKITQNYSSGDVVASDTDAGGFFGLIHHPYPSFASTLTCNTDYSTRPSRFEHCQIHKLDNVVISDNYAKGNVTAAQLAGGFAGSTPNIMVNGYSSGSVVGATAGGFHGNTTTPGGTFVNCWRGGSTMPAVFWNASKNLTVLNNTMQSRAEDDFGQEATFAGGSGTPPQPEPGCTALPTPGFDFSNVWKISNGYPVFKWQD